MEGRIQEGALSARVTPKAPPEQTRLISTDAWRPLPRTCDGCGELLEPGDGAQLWLEAPLGLCSVYVHRNADHVCLERAREARGGGRFMRLGPTKEEKMKRDLGVEE